MIKTAEFRTCLMLYGWPYDRYHALANHMHKRPISALKKADKKSFIGTFQTYDDPSLEVVQAT